MIRVQHANRAGASSVAQARSRGWAKLAAVVSSLAIAATGFIGANLQPAQAATGTITESNEAPGSSVAAAIDADAIASAPGTPGHLNDWQGIEAVGNGTRVTGYGLLLDNTLAATNGGGNTPLPENTPIYLQWIDKDNSVSPIYKTVTHNGFSNAPNGAYAFAVPSWTESDGTVHEFKPGVGSNPKIRVWFEPFTDTRTNSQVVQIRSANTNPRFIDYAYGAGTTTLEQTYVNNYALFGYTYPLENFTTAEDQWVDSPLQAGANRGPIQNGNSISGHVWLEGEGSSITVGPDAIGEGNGNNAKGYQVIWSTLTAEGKTAADNINKMPKEQQAAEYARVFKEHPEYIAETVKATTDDNGDYLAQFSDKFSQDALYGFVRDPNGVVLPAYSSYTAPGFFNPNKYGLIVPQSVPAWTVNHWYNANFAVVPYYNPSLDITNYNTSNRPAPKGGEALLDVNGYLSQGGNSIVWTDSKGTEVKRCDGIKTIAAAEACTFTVPADAQDGEIYIASLVNANNIIAADSFVVAGDDDGDGSTGPKDPDPDNSGKPGTGDPADTQNVTHGVKLVDGQGKAIAGKNPILSDGSRDKADAELRVTYKKAQNSDLSGIGVTLADKDGKVADANAEETDTVSAWRGAKGYPVVRNFGLAEFAKGTYAVAVTEDIDYWAVTKASQLKNNGSLEVTGLTPNQFVELGYDSDNNGVADVDEAPQNERFDPTYQDSTTRKDQPLTIAAPKDDPNGELKGNLPAGTTFAAGTGVPAGVVVDPATGVITVPANTFDAGVRNIPVVVTYPDETVDNINAKVTVTEPAPTQTDADRHDPGYQPAEGKPGATVKVPQTGDTKLPQGTKFTVTGPGMTVDPATGEVSVVVPAGAKPGDKINGTVTVTYPDKSTDTVPVVVTVVPTDAQKYAPVYEDLTVAAGSTKSGKAPADPAQALPQGVKFAAKANTFPAWAQVDPTTGVITASPSADVKPGTYSTGRVVVTYQDGSADTISAKIIVTEAAVNPTQADQFSPAYTPTTVKQGGTATVAAPVAPEGALPSGTTFTPVASTFPVWATIDGNTGAITVKPGLDVKPGDYTARVDVRYPDGSADTINATITVVALTDAERLDPGTGSATGEAGASVPVEWTGDSIPGGSTVGTTTPGWTFDVDDQGKVTVHIPGDATPGAHELPVTVTYPDGSTDTTTVTVTVVPTDAQKYAPAYADLSVQAGSTKAGQAPADPAQALPQGTTFSAVTGTFPAWATLDGATGVVTASPAADVAVGNYSTPRVLVAYPDGSTDTVPAKIVVTAAPAPVRTQAEQYSPAYTEITVKRGETGTVAAPTAPEGALPQGTTFTKVANVNSFPAWGAVDPDTGVITVKPTDAVALRRHMFRVDVRYPDGSADTINAFVTVTEADTVPAPGTGSASGKPGATVPVAWTGTPIPGGATVVTTTPGWTLTVDPDTGVTSVVIPGAVTPGEVELPVTVTYPDGKTVDTTVTVTVVPTDAQKYAPVYEDLTVAAGSTKSGKAPADPAQALPQGVKFAAKANTFPAWAQVDPTTGVITASPGADVTPGTYSTGRVVVTYQDGSADTISAKIIVTEAAVNPTDADRHDPGYKPATGKPGATVRVPQTGDKNLPQNTKFTVTGPGMTVDPATGEVTVVVPDTAKPGDRINGTVTVTYPDKSTDTVPVVVTVVPTDAQKTDPGTGSATGEAGASVPVEWTGDSIPGGSTVGTTTPGWTFDVDDQGKVTVHIPGDATPGAHELPVTVTYPDGSTDTTTVTVTVVDDTPKPGTGSATGTAGSSVPVEWTGDSIPGGSTVTGHNPGWTFTVDTDGKVTVTFPGDVKPGKVELPVTVTYPDGRTVDTTVTVTVTAVRTVKVAEAAALAKTGAEGLPVALAAALLTLAGVGVAVLRRRRNA